jgi:hypothetical protein
VSSPGEFFNRLLALDGLRAAAEGTIALLKERRAALIAAAAGKIAVPTRPASGKTGVPYEN